MGHDLKIGDPFFPKFERRPHFRAVVTRVDDNGTDLEIEYTDGDLKGMRQRWISEDRKLGITDCTVLSAHPEDPLP